MTVGTAFPVIAAVRHRGGLDIDHLIVSLVSAVIVLAVLETRRRRTVRGASERPTTVAAPMTPYASVRCDGAM